MKRILIITRGPLVNFRQMPGGTNRTADGEYEFHLNTIDVRPDFVAVIGKGIRQPVTFDADRRHTLLLTNEPHDIFEYPRNYCRQFGTVCSCQEEMHADNVLHTPAFLPWHIGYIPQSDGTVTFTKSYDDIASAQPEKTKLISVISSKKALCRGHVDRLHFIDRLQQRYGDRIDVYGNGYNSFGDKWDVLAPYKYHIVIENSSTDYYWTEKLGDCYLASAFPLYHGCTNIDRYFPGDAYERIDIRNTDRTFATIDRILASQLYEERRAQLQQAKQSVMDKYNFFNMLADVCRTITDADDGTRQLMKPARQMSSLHNVWLYTMGRNYYKLLSLL